MFITKCDSLSVCMSLPVHRIGKNSVQNCLTGFGGSTYGGRPAPRQDHHHMSTAHARSDTRQYEDHRPRPQPRAPRVGSKVVAAPQAHPINPTEEGEAGEARTARHDDRGHGRYDERGEAGEARTAHHGDRGRGRYDEGGGHRRQSNRAGSSPRRRDSPRRREGSGRERERSPVHLEAPQPPPPRPVVRSTVVASGEVKVAPGDYSHRNPRCVAGTSLNLPDRTLLLCHITYSASPLFQGCSSHPVLQTCLVIAIKQAVIH
jgi:hypothetical protein